jgi:hypothetical protein
MYHHIEEYPDDFVPHWAKVQIVLMYAEYSATMHVTVYEPGKLRGFDLIEKAIEVLYAQNGRGEISLRSSSGQDIHHLDDTNGEGPSFLRKFVVDARIYHLELE